MSKSYEHDMVKGECTKCHKPTSNITNTLCPIIGKQEFEGITRNAFDWDHGDR